MLLSQPDQTFGELVLRLLPRLGLAALVFSVAIIAYRLTLHPLAKYPGPFWGKISGAWPLYHAWKGDRHLQFYKYHEKYGKFVRIGPNTLSINSNTALQDIYAPKANVQKAHFYTAFAPTPKHTDVFSTINKKDHARKRRTMASGFSDAAIRSQGVHMLENIVKFCEGVGPKAQHKKGSVQIAGDVWGDAVNVGEWTNFLSFDVMGDLCFGKSFGLLEGPENKFALELAREAPSQQVLCAHVPIVHQLYIDRIIFPYLTSLLFKYVAYAGKQCAARKELGLDTERKDIFHYLLVAKDPETGEGLSQHELEAESNTLMVAGSDTTSTALSATFFYLTHNADAYNKAAEEVRRTFTDLNLIEHGASINSLVYLRACIDEALRLAPPVASITPRVTLTGGITVDGHHIPEGIDLACPHYVLHHNPEYYPDPYKYQPERWIVDSSAGWTDKKVSTAKSAFCPFSVGPRSCMGRNMAYAEMMVTMARILFMYDFRVAPGTNVGGGKPDGEEGRQRPDEFQLTDKFTALKDGPLVQFRVKQEGANALPN